MSKKKLSAGDIIESGCTRCRTVMNHTIVAMVGEKVVRVQCNTCNGIHNYKPSTEKTAAKNATPRKSAAPRKSRKDPAAADREEWQTLYPTMNSEQAIAYEMTGKFKLKDLVEHPVFGLGIVKSVVPNKVEVLFQEGKKLLRCQ